MTDFSAVAFVHKANLETVPCALINAQLLNSAETLPCFSIFPTEPRCLFTYANQPTPQTTKDPKSTTFCFGNSCLTQSKSVSILLEWPRMRGSFQKQFNRLSNENGLKLPSDTSRQEIMEQKSTLMRVWKLPDRTERPVLSATL